MEGLGKVGAGYGIANLVIGARIRVEGCEGQGVFCLCFGEASESNSTIGKKNKNRL